MKDWNDDKLQEFLDKKQAGEAAAKPDDLDQNTKENLVQYEKLYDMLKEQPDINLPDAFTKSVLNRIEQGKQNIWSTIWSVLSVLAGLIVVSAVAFFVTQPYLNVGEFGTFFYKNIIPNQFKTVLGDLKVHFDFVLLGFGIASFLTIIFLDRWLKPQNSFRAS